MGNINSYMIVIEGVVGTTDNKLEEIEFDLQVIVVAKDDSRAEDLAESVIYHLNFLNLSLWDFKDIYIKDVTEVSDSTSEGVKYYIKGSNLR